MKNNGTGQNNGSRYIIFLAAITAVPAMATDMYLAAMPIIAKQWGVPDSRVALSLVLWFASFSVFLLVYGPLSDKHGRRPILLTGLALFTAASAACALATNVTALIVLRVLQGIGTAGPSSMCMAICHDIGSASSFLVFNQFTVRAVCMKIVTAPWQAPIRVFGLVALLLPVFVLAVWPLLLHLLRPPQPLATAPESANAA